MDWNSSEHKPAELPEEALAGVTGGEDKPVDTGYDTYTCKTCGNVYTSATTATGHYYETDPHHDVFHQY